MPRASLQGVKLELFIFDTFPLATSTALLEVGGSSGGPRALAVLAIGFCAYRS